MTREEPRGAQGVEFFKQALSGELIFRRASGEVVTKSEFLAQLGDPSNGYETLRASRPRVAVLSDVALARLIITTKGMRGGHHFEGIFENLRVFRHSDGGWRCLVWFNSRMQ
jgi:hypothetical protein